MRDLDNSPSRVILFCVSRSPPLGPLPLALRRQRSAGDDSDA